MNDIYLDHFDALLKGSLRLEARLLFGLLISNKFIKSHISLDRVRDSPLELTFIPSLYSFLEAGLVPSVA